MKGQMIYGNMEANVPSENIEFENLDSMFESFQEKLKNVQPFDSLCFILGVKGAKKPSLSAFVINGAVILRALDSIGEYYQEFIIETFNHNVTCLVHGDSCKSFAKDKKNEAQN